MLKCYRGSMGNGSPPINAVPSIGRWVLFFYAEMETGFARSFYNSGAWQRCREGYKTERNHLCERCLAKGLIVPGVEVHHKIKLTPENINDPAVALNWDNLELLCKNCHMEEHRGVRWRADELGRIAL